MKPKDWDKVANDYYSEILSPLQDAIKNPLWQVIKKLPKSSIVADVGCGTGKLLPKLKKFKKVVAFDFSQGMLAVARNKHHNQKNVEFALGDMVHLKKWNKKFDVVFSINSLLSPDSKLIQTSIKQLRAMLKPGGKLIVIVPAMEVYLYQAMLYEEQLKKEGHSDRKVAKKLKKSISDKEHNFLQGIYTFEKAPQKAFYDFEIWHRFRKAGFSKIMVDKVYYPWSEFAKAGQMQFPKAALPWDWFVMCKK